MSTLVNLLKGIFTRLSNSKKIELKQLTLASDAAELLAAGNPRAAIDLYKKFLAIEPRNVDALNNIGVCLAETGDMQGAYRAFDLAYSLDDSNMSVVLNHARHLIDNKNIGEAMPHVIRARVTVPQYPYINAVYATTRLALGDAKGAQFFVLQAWLAQFDNLRLANSYMFSSSYADLPEKLLATEHVFWAQTMSAPPVLETPGESKIGAPDEQKLRIGYWSPDFRAHSVRYFFRPLLEGHDKNKVETFLYHDAYISDAQTELIKNAGGSFHEVALLSDQELTDLIISHELDVLIELAGHTSHNRLPLLKKRLAKLQLTGLGYPPTTGLSTVDGKFLDPFIVDENASRFYSEEPLVLPHSFWCFDPLEPAPEEKDPPLVKNGYVTFGCVGNIAKINERMIGVWAEILRRVPKSRLLIRSVNFVDPAAELAMREMLQARNFPIERTDLVGPASGTEFFTSYHGIDIILDTSPFNGGTTTCFAVYMGVPVVSLRGESVVGRMGASVLGNIGASDLVVETENQYIARAIAASQDLKFLRRFKTTARSLMQQCSLGNGRLFAADVEAACRIRLKRVNLTKSNLYSTSVEPLPAMEMIRRAYVVLGHNQKDAASRIVDYCLRIYPSFAPAHILKTEELTSAGKYLDAATYLQSRLSAFLPEHHTAVIFNIIRNYLLARHIDLATEALAKIDSNLFEDQYDKLQFDLYRNLLSTATLAVDLPSKKSTARGLLVCLLPCDQAELYTALVNSMKQRCEIPEGVEIEYQSCNEVEKLFAYRALMLRDDVDFVLIIQKNLQIHSKMFFFEIIGALSSYELIGFSGARRWSRLDWQVDDFNQKMGGCFLRSSENIEMFEVQLQGPGAAVLQGEAVVLDGALLAFNRRKLHGVLFDEQLTQARLLLEEAWSNTVHHAGYRVGVHRHLGVELMEQITFDERYLAAAKLRVLELKNFHPFIMRADDRMSISVPVENCTTGVHVLDRYFNESPAET
ncbi:hypothetical protein GN316_09150 [Xylophilus sp. Kf1]|nr:hypothetical protein [Xylophilus sp. Kf1]